VLSDLETASSRLVDRRFHAFQTEDYDAVTVKAGGKERRFKVPSAGKLTSADGQETNDEFARNWHDRLWRTYAVDLLGKGEAPAGGEPQVELRVDYARGDKAQGFLEMGRAGTELYARSENTAGWVKLGASADSLLKESPRIAGGEAKDDDAKKAGEPKPGEPAPK
jgi:hypothetical protein